MCLGINLGREMEYQLVRSDLHLFSTWIKDFCLSKPLRFGKWRTWFTKERVEGERYDGFEAGKNYRCPLYTYVTREAILSELVTQVLHLEFFSQNQSILHIRVSILLFVLMG